MTLVEWAGGVLLSLSLTLHWRNSGLREHPCPVSASVLSADDSFGLSDGSSITLKGHDNPAVEVKSTNIAMKPVKFDQMVWKNYQESNTDF